jgi:hypothetical protein
MRKQEILPWMWKESQRINTIILLSSERRKGTKSELLLDLAWLRSLDDSNSHFLEVPEAEPSRGRFNRSKFSGGSEVPMTESL